LSIKSTVKFQALQCWNTEYARTKNVGLKMRDRKMLEQNYRGENLGKVMEYDTIRHDTMHYIYLNPKADE